jgi:hypothetical protein
MTHLPKPYGKIFAAGVISISLYVLLFFYEDEVMASFTRSDGFYPALPVLTALVFSLAHGAFTGYFWEVVGVRGKAGAEKK